MCPIGEERKFAAAQPLCLKSWGPSAVTALAALQESAHGTQRQIAGVVGVGRQLGVKR
jgi:hypothetical protein